MSRRTSGWLIAAALLLLGCSPAYAGPQSGYTPYRGPFDPVVVPEAVRTAPGAHRAFYEPAATSARPAPAREPVARAVPKPERRVPASPPTRAAVANAAHVLAGVASWYCRAGRSVCPAGWGPGFMGAAACAPLRAAMGPGWRGRVVSVTANGRLVTVKLVDYCASTGKTIDLFWLPMSMLGGTGVLHANVRW